MMCCVADESDDDKSLGFGLEVDVGLGIHGVGLDVGGVGLNFSGFGLKNRGSAWINSLGFNIMELGLTTPPHSSVRLTGVCLN
jgi:hypothetical protein